MSTSAQVCHGLVFASSAESSEMATSIMIDVPCSTRYARTASGSGLDATQPPIRTSYAHSISSTAMLAMPDRVELNSATSSSDLST